MRRNIQRILAAEQARNNRDEEEDEDASPQNYRGQRKRAHSVSSNIGPNESPVSRVKAEQIRSSMARGSVIPSTQLGAGVEQEDEDLDDIDGNGAPPMSTAEIVDLGGEDDEEEDDDES